MSLSVFKSVIVRFEHKIYLDIIKRHVQSGVQIFLFVTIFKTNVSQKTYEAKDILKGQSTLLEENSSMCGPWN